MSMTLTSRRFFTCSSRKPRSTGFGARGGSERSAGAVARPTVHLMWSYYVHVVKNTNVPYLQTTLTKLGADGWALVSALTTVKTVNLSGNDLAFVFKKAGVGHFPPTLITGVDLDVIQ